MAYSYLKIEKEKTRFVYILFLILITFHFLTFFLAWFVLKNTFINYEALRSADIPFGIYPVSVLAGIVILFFSLIVTLVHLFLTANNMVERIVTVLGAYPVDKKDYYNKLYNLLEEASVAVGGMKVKPLVIATSGVNIFSISDYSGNAYVGVTEGALSRLSRSQLESVVAYAVANIASGDSTLVTFASSIVGLYAAHLESFVDQECLVETTFNGGVVAIVVSFMLMLNRKVLMLLSMERIFKVDALAVKLSRNPQSLAESLYIMSKSYKGNLNVSEGLSSLFIVDPCSLGEELSLHPPIKERIDVLLNLAHCDSSILQKYDSVMKNKPLPSKIEKVKPENKKESETNGWYARHENLWLGPYSLNQLKGLSWFTVNHLIRREGSLAVKKAIEDTSLSVIFNKTQELSDAEMSCPYCYHGLSKEFLEGVPVNRCGLCKGVLVPRVSVNTILIREDLSFSEEIVRLAKLMRSESLTNSVADQGAIKTPFLISCPKCNKKMKRKFFSGYARVEVDVCIWCDLIWFDRGELDVVQAIYDDLPDKDQIIG